MNDFDDFWAWKTEILPDYWNFIKIKEIDETTCIQVQICLELNGEFYKNDKYS